LITGGEPLVWAGFATFRPLDEEHILSTSWTKLPSFADVLRGTSIKDWQEFSDPDNPEKSGKGHLLMRPLGQLALAKAVGYLHNDPDGLATTNGGKSSA
tara:strand:+ start:260 stop:556 length:297 start_codon:yes stop_codon:yes gene_type:complete